ncbi:BTB/POZ domain and ankyrin repeat-containing protein NPR2-like [Herrania umbratica]|uniref:BTB/POZ domain and ankyrin repeat-containing protein NPR2-like n=1 Tax=Herrania umbratica TaxID=108875 RepID=A0A6J1BPF1_9ROSI|nr:BTB/POZ domain and ankyrin repeat-containing protein NPR2-like [Herrania umbratica]
MEYGNEISSPLSFASSSYLSDGSGGHLIEAATSTEDPGANLEILSLKRLSCSLEKLLVDQEYDYSDAEIVVDGNIAVGVNRCILAGRSQYFHELFRKGRDDNSMSKEGKPQYLLSQLVPHGRVGYEAFKVFLNYLYTGKVKPSPREISTCMDDACAHDACGPLITYALELMYASATFQMKELVLLVQRHLLNFVGKALVEDVIPILVAAFHYQLNQLLYDCIQRVATSDLDDACLEKELPWEVYVEIRSVRLKSHKLLAEPGAVELEPMLEKRIKRIHKALDSDDVELLGRLLAESNVTLDDAFALHYAAAYCDSKVVNEVLSLCLANVNLRNPRGYTVLHVAARRKEPSVLVTLLNKGACVAETTPDGQTAVAICRRLTRPKDYNENKKQGELSNKDRLCIDVLEREMRNSLESYNQGVSSQVMHDDLHMKLDYYENRVSFARLLFPAEAKLATEIADADSNIREVNLNESPSMQTKRLQLRLQTLLRTVATGRRYFPHCSDVLDKFLVDDMSDPSLFEEGSPEEQRLKKRRFTELKEELQQAFYKDIAEKKRSTSSPSCSSSSSTAKEGGAAAAAAAAAPLRHKTRRK